MRCRNVATGAAGGATVRILWVSPFLPHPKARHAGGRGEFGWMAALAERHDITLVARMEPEERDAAIALRPVLRGLHLLTFARPGGPARRGADRGLLRPPGPDGPAHPGRRRLRRRPRRVARDRAGHAPDERRRPRERRDRRAHEARATPRRAGGGDARTACAASSGCGRSRCCSTASARSSTSCWRSPSRTATRSARWSRPPTCGSCRSRSASTRRSSRARPVTTTTCCSSAR